MIIEAIAERLRELGYNCETDYTVMGDLRVLGKKNPKQPNMIRLFGSEFGGTTIWKNDTQEQSENRPLGRELFIILLDGNWIKLYLYPAVHSSNRNLIGKVDLTSPNSINELFTMLEASIKNGFKF